MNTLYDEDYTDAADYVRQLTETVEGLYPAYQKEAIRNIGAGAGFVKRIIRDAASSGSASLALCNRLLIRLKKAMDEDPTLRHKLLDMEMEIDFIHDKVALANEHISLLNPYIIERLNYSIEYTKVFYDQTHLDHEL